MNMIDPEGRHEESHSRHGVACMSRRQMLLSGGTAVAVVTLTALPGMSLASPLHALKADYPREKIARLSGLELNQPLEFAYPYANVSNMLVRLGVPAGGGVGPDEDVVAFGQLCSHMGGPMHGTFKKDHQILGPCPLHLTTFDLTRHGMVVSGHATQSLPQIVLEAEGDDIYAIGVLGLIYGYAANITARRA